MLEKKINLKAAKVGSALIMTVVLTVLLAIVAVMFVMVARMDSASTSNIVDSKTLDNAAKSIIEIIGKELVLDTPGVALKAGLLPKSDYPQYYDYQDYPDVYDAWLANIEPYLYSDNGTPADTSDDIYKWRQISDITGYLKSSSATKSSFATRYVKVDPPGSRKVIQEYPDIILNANNELDEGNPDDGESNTEYRGQLADADGDGIADSKWIELSDLNSSKGKKVYAAIRIIDNCAMININTAYKFDDTSTEVKEIDGTSQMQINLKGLLKLGDDIDVFHEARSGGVGASWDSYRNDVIWKYDSVPSGSYLPFDISDELELRYRYCIDSSFASRLETSVGALPKTTQATDLAKNCGWLYNTDTGKSGLDWGLEDWQDRIAETNRALAEADRRHLLTTYSFDRIIDPDGNPMFNVRSGGSAQALYERLVGGTGLAGCIERLGSDPLLGNIANMNYYLAQIAANIVDYGDIGNEVSVVRDLGNAGNFYGYEPPFMFISEIARNFVEDGTGIHHSYAIELYKNFDKDGSQDFDSGNWKLFVNGELVKDLSSDDFDRQGGQYYVIVSEETGAEFATDDIKYTDSPENGASNVSKDVILTWPKYWFWDETAGEYREATLYKLYFGQSGSLPLKYADGVNRSWQPSSNGEILGPGETYKWRVEGYDAGGALIPRPDDVWEFTVGNPEPQPDTVMFSFGTITLKRRAGNGDYITVDEVTVPADFTDEAVMNLGLKSYQRDMRWNYYLKGIWNDDWPLPPTLGYKNTFEPSYPSTPMLPPWHHSFTTVGDAAMVFRESTYLNDISLPYIREGGVLSYPKGEPEFRFDVYCPSMQNIFKYITALNPADYASNNPDETRVRGRININTAPAFVIAQLPWASAANRHNLKIADAIVAYRDKLDISPAPASGPDYYHDGAIDARQTETGLLLSKYVVRTDPGFSSIGELMNVINGGINGDSSKKEYDIRYCGIDGKTQYGFPGLYDNEALYNPDMTDTKVQDDLEEKELVFARISDLATVRSDTFTAYILVRVGVDGPQKRFIAILDRTGVKEAKDKVKVAAFQQVPAAR